MFGNYYGDSINCSNQDRGSPGIVNMHMNNIWPKTRLDYMLKRSEDTPYIYEI